MTATAFVTGSTGFLGRHLCQQLVDADWHVTAMCRSIPENPVDGVKYVTADLSDKAAMAAVLPDHVHVIFHTAADTSTWRLESAQQTQTNVQGTLNLMQVAIEKNAKKFIYVSSITTFGVDHHGLIELDENTPQEGESSWVNYVRTKSLAEGLVKDHADKLNALVVNPTHIIGPDDQHNWIRLFKMMISDSLPTVPIGSGSFVDVRDVARGCILAAEKGQPGENYILGGNNLSFVEFVKQSAEVLQLKVTLRNKPQWLLKAVAAIKLSLSHLTRKQPDLTPESLQIISHQFTTTSNKAKTELGYVIRPIENSLKDIKTDLEQRGIL
ncbi:NAD-dependent epimerase/dehydratase family protein [Marinicella sp. S1101]|uniref:NAD-dependent epimerase/dehydratase family protein n=1 Tax=Marinicella marina TaxID=2996016 RepID=UPI002260C325|nr:NAD-dependent epimerase/dehydratase family protein [Marinicella marina]MCX7552340.1 NAD-dependent epimerase/dehydratase family protein [Marinicella marina]MDJ1139215.1 NAD-dependent epimerase/dehydratase family protein [Marinicella marina]